MSEEKILKSEELNDEQLDEAAGGSREQIYSDVEFFRKIGVHVPMSYLGTPCIAAAWAAIGGIDCREFADYEKNHYFLNGEEITQDEARIHAIKFMKNKNK